VTADDRQNEHPELDVVRFVSEWMAAQPEHVQERMLRDWEKWPRVTVAVGFDHDAGTFTVLASKTGIMFPHELPEGTAFTMRAELRPDGVAAVVDDITDPWLVLP
jgi:hypothetical protein